MRFLQFDRSTITLFSSRFESRRWSVLFIVLLGVVLIGTSSAAAISFVLKWGTVGTADGQFIGPRGIAVDSVGNVYVAGGDPRIQKFDSAGTFIFKFGGSGSSNPGEFVSPVGVAVDSAGNIYVTDSFPDRTNHFVQKFNSSGVFQTSWGTQGAGNSQFFGAGGVAVDASGNVYVADPANHRIQKFTSAGVFITKWGSMGAGDGQFSGPQGVSVDSSGNVYVADTGNSRIQKFDSSGTFLAKWGTAGSADGQFSGPWGVSPDTSGNVYVSDTGNNRIQKFSSAGTFIEAFGASGTGDGQFSGPQYVAADATGNIYVSDTGNDRVQMLSNTTPTVVANAGTDQTHECAGSLTPVTLDGTGSTGAGTLTYIWTEGATTLGTGATLAVSLPQGSHNITLTVTSSGGGSDDDDVAIIIQDTMAPSITINGSNPLTVECHTSFSDPGATAADSCAGSVAVTPSGVVDVNTPGTYIITYSATDGTNSAMATRTVNVIDSTGPVISCPSNITVTLPPNSTATSATVSFTVTATDSCSSSVTVTTDHASGSSFPVGTTTVTATADDHNGNTSSCSFTISVLYNFTGFFPPVSNPPVLNVVNAGRAIPVKFSLSGDKGLNIFALNSPASGDIVCNSSDPAADLQDTVTAGGSSLSYDAASDQYIYVWKTSSSWAGTCRQLVVQLNDGSIHLANFKFR